MHDCAVCTSLQGRPADVLRTDKTTLIGIGQCEGVTAIEHYRCEQCGGVLARQLCGCSSEQVWTVLA